VSTGFPPGPGDGAPDFELPTDSGSVFKLSAERGHPVVLYFYPQDDTEGCSIENHEFSVLLPEFTRLGARVVGISPDSLESHRAFRAKCGLTTTLAADPDHIAIDAYCLWGPKVTFGHHHIGLHRTSFLIDRDGRIGEVWQVKRIKGHAEKVLESVRALST
jgi:peroxiredoxin Q/BCP